VSSILIYVFRKKWCCAAFLKMFKGKCIKILNNSEYLFLYDGINYEVLLCYESVVVRVRVRVMVFNATFNKISVI